jgi:hypothetical protein
VLRGVLLFSSTFFALISVVFVAGLSTGGTRRNTRPES